MSLSAAPSVSVVVPVYNRLPLLRATVQSLKRQTLSNAEFLLIDDRSDPDVAKFLFDLSRDDRRFRIYRKPNESPQGCQASRNIGLELATAPYLVFLDSDDLLAPDCLVVRLKFMEANPDADIVVGNQAVFMQASGDSFWVNQADSETSDLERFLRLAGPCDVPWVNGGCMLRVSALRSRHIGWRHEFHWDDVVFHLECLMEGLRVRWLPRSLQPDSCYRVHGGEHYGNTLRTVSGLESICRMLLFVMRRLRDSGKLNVQRHASIKRSFFLTSLLPAVDREWWAEASHLMNLAGDSALLSRSELIQIHRFLKIRKLTTRYPRLRFYANRFARTCLIPRLFEQSASTYCVTPLSEEGMHTLSELLASCQSCAQSEA